VTPSPPSVCLWLPDKPASDERPESFVVDHAATPGAATAAQCPPASVLPGSLPVVWALDLAAGAGKLGRLGDGRITPENTGNQYRPTLASGCPRSDGLGPGTGCRCWGLDGLGRVHVAVGCSGPKLPVAAAQLAPCVGQKDQARRATVGRG